MSKSAVRMQKSFTAVMLDEFEKQSSDVYGVRQDLVDRFRFLIDTNRYHVSAAQIAQAMMDDGMFPDDVVEVDL